MVRASNFTLVSPAAAFWAFLFGWHSKRPQGSSQNDPRGEKKLAHFAPHFRMRWGTQRKSAA
jgi:hypothetical protein